MLPKPLSPLLDSASDCDSFHFIDSYLEITNWAILSPELILKFSDDKLISITPTSPL